MIFCSRSHFVSRNCAIYVEILISCASRPLLLLGSFEFFFPSKKMHFEKIYHHFYFYLKWNFFKCQIFQTVKKIEKKNCNDFPSDMIMFGSMQNIKKNELRIQFSIKIYSLQDMYNVHIGIQEKMHSFGKFQTYKK